MFVLIIFSFLGGIITILSPCILPILPIVLSGSVTGGKQRPFGVVTGFIASFTFFTLFLTVLVKATGLSPDILRIFAVAVISLFGLGLIIPSFQAALERIFSRLANAGPKANTGDGFLSGIVVGLSLGLVWTPCVGPILASIIALAATQSVGLNAVILTLVYAFGTSLPLLAITFGGRRLLTNHPWLIKQSASIQKLFGVLMLLTALAIFFSWDRMFQTFILKAFPNYGTGLTAIENNPSVQKQLQQLKNTKGGNVINDLLEPNYGNAPDFSVGGQWFNTTPLTIQSLRGKVVVIDFWTYTCINCIRTLPYVKTWWTKYKDKGLVIVGVHTPEFEFEKNPDNVAKAIKDFGITYPVMQDNAYATWNTYTNQYWPAEYFIDKNGKIRFTHFGEGNYDESEGYIQTLLAETGITNQPTIHNEQYQVYGRTPETYVGYSRMAGLASGEHVHPDKAVMYMAPTALSANTFAFNGTWNVGAERTIPSKGAALTYRFSAKNVYLVMRPHTTGTVSKIKITIDGKDIGSSAGADVVNGMITVDTDRLYTLVNLTQPGEHIVKLEFLDGNAELYAFTFG